MLKKIYKNTSLRFLRTKGSPKILKLKEIIITEIIVKIISLCFARSWDFENSAAIIFFKKLCPGRIFSYNIFTFLVFKKNL